MYAYVAALALAGSASARVLPRDQAGCCFQLTASGGKSGTVGQLSDGQNRIGGGYKPATYCLNNGGLTDSNGRGCILTPPTTQFQCDVGATPTTGFSVSGSGEVEYNGSDEFYACGAASGEYNIYTKPVENQADCVKVTLSTGGKCSGNGGAGSGSSSAPAMSAASTKPAGGASSSAPASTMPAAMSSQPKPSSKQPAPETSMMSQPKPYTGAPKPMTSQPAPAMSQPQPEMSQPQPEMSQPAPNCPYSPPMSQPQPEMSQPAAQTSQPMSEMSQSKPYASQPPMETSQAPASSQPKPEMSQPAQKTSQAPAPSMSAPASSAASSPAMMSSAPAMSSSGPSGTAKGSACPTSLTGAYQTPHLIVPISKEQPDKSYGTNYNGQINSTTSTIFNFDIPMDYQGKQCSIVFLFPKKEDLETSDYTFGGSGSLGCSELSSAANQKTSWSNAPSVAKDLGSYELQPGNSYVVATQDCKAGETQSIELSSENGLSLNFFEDWNPSPLGLFITSC